MLKSVKLYGELAEKYGKEWSLDIESPAEAIRALCANNKGFRQFVDSSEERGVGYKVVVADQVLENPFAEIQNPTGRQEIKIIPVVGGAKSGIGQVIIGALMIYAAVMTAGLAVQGAALTAAGGAGTAAGGAIAGLSHGAIFSIGAANLGGMSLMAAKFGAALLLGGIASMLAPTPKPVEDKESVQNYAFNGAANTTRQGVCIPVCYGQLIVGGAVISSGVEPEDYTP